MKNLKSINHKKIDSIFQKYRHYYFMQNLLSNFEWPAAMKLPKAII